jgi:hypothetical protein
MSCDFKNCPLYYPCLEMLDESPECATKHCGTQPTDVQQLKAEIRAMCIELECTIHEKFDSGMYHALRGRLRELSAI